VGVEEDGVGVEVICMCHEIEFWERAFQKKMYKPGRLVSLLLLTQ